MTVRERTHLEALQRRLAHLDDRIRKLGHIRGRGFDTEEAAALRWAIRKCDGRVTVGEVLDDLRAAGPYPPLKGFRRRA